MTGLVLSKRPRKLGEIIAARILADIAQQGWRADSCLGNEADLMKRYAISRATFREAVRQLEWHGTAVMRRGANGGLLIKAPPRDAIVRAIRIYFALTHVEQAQRADVSAILRAAPRLETRPGTNEAIALFLEALDRPAPPQDACAPTTRPKLSETTARQIVLDIEAAAHQQGTVLGSAADLQERYGVSRAVLREALRPLELHDIIRIKTGVYGGVVVHRCDPGYTIELAGTYLSSAGIPLSHLWEAQSSLHIAAVERLSRTLVAEGLDDLRRAFAKLERATAPHYFASALAFHQCIADQTDNRALSLLIGIVLHFALAVLPPPDPRALPGVKGEHLRFLDALAAGDGAAASAIMRGMFDTSRRWILRLEAAASAP